MISFLLGDVASHRVDQPAVDDGCRAPGQPSVVSGACPVAVLEVDRRRPGGEIAHLLHGLGVIFRVNELDELARQQLLAVVAEDSLEGRIDLLEVAVEAGHTHQVERQPKEASEILLGCRLPRGG